MSVDGTTLPLLHGLRDGSLSGRACSLFSWSSLAPKTLHGEACTVAWMLELRYGPRGIVKYRDHFGCVELRDFVVAEVYTWGRHVHLEELVVKYHTLSRAWDDF